MKNMASKLPEARQRTTCFVWPVAFALCLSSFSACNTYEEEADIQDPPLKSLRPVYDVTVSLVGSDCELGGFLLDPLSAVANVSQSGNTVAWVQQGVSTVASTVGSQPWTMRGRLCSEGGGVVLRLRGGRIDRLEDSDGFCRADLRLPAAHAECVLPTEPTEICQDAASIPFPIDPCTGHLEAEFTSCLRFGENCAGQASCRVTFKLTASPRGWDAPTACNDSPPSVEADQCASICDECACSQ